MSALKVTPAAADGDTMTTSTDLVATSPLAAHQRDVDAARALTATAREAIGNANAWAEVAAELIGRAWTTRADVALGYGSWEAYVDVEFAGVKDLRLPAAGRRRIVAALSAAGMSTRKGARPLGISEGQWRLDLKAVRAAEQAELAAAAEQPDAELAEPVAPAPATRAARARAAVHAAGERGLTSVELGRRVRDLPDPSAILSEDHKAGRLARLSVLEASGTRDGFAVYVDPEHTGGRGIEPPGRRSRRRLDG